MDEQSIQNYLNLIRQLLNCSNDQAIEILQASSPLSDEGVVVLPIKIDTEQTKNSNDSLQKFVSNLAEEIEEWNQLSQQVIESYHSDNYSEGIRVAEQALKLAKQIWGNEHPDVASSLNNLATLYEAQGDYLRAEKTYLKALKMKEKLLGKEHLDVASSKNNIAALYEAQGRFSEAETLLLEAWQIRKCLLKADDIRIADSLNNLAVLYNSQGRYSLAQRNYLESLSIYTKLFGEEHSLVATVLNNLAGLHDEKGSYSEAEQKYLEALKVYNLLLEKESTTVAVILSNLAGIYNAQGRYSEAEQKCLEALDMKKKLLGEEHPSMATSLNMLAGIFDSQGHYLEAETKYLEALDMRKKLLGEEHPGVATILNNLAGIYNVQRRYSEAEQKCLEALDMRRKLLGEEHPGVAVALNNLAEVYSSQGRYVKAKALHLKALLRIKYLLGDEHPNVADCLRNLAILLAASDQFTEAISQMIQASEIEDKMIGSLFAFSSESDRLSYLKKIRINFDGLLSLVYNHLSDSAQAIQSALDLILKRKALTASALAAQNEALYSDRYPHLTKDFHKLRDLSEQIIHITFSTPQTEDFSTYQQQLAQLQAEHNSLQKNLASQVPEIQLQEQLPNRNDVASELPTGSILIEFVRFDVFNFKAIPAKGEAQWQPARYLAFILPAGQPESVEMIDIGEAEYIDNLIREFRELVSGAGKNPESQLGMFSKRPPKLNFREYHPQAAIKLRQAIFDKLRPALKEHQHLIIAPDGELNLVPFQILPSDDTGEKMLMDEFTISYLTVGRDILRQKIETKCPASLNALVFASPNFDLSAESVTSDAAPKQNIQTDNLRECIANKPLEDAVGTNILGERVAQKLKVASYLGSEALESYFKPLECPRILLIATHGVFLPNQPEDPSLTVPYQRESGLWQRDRFFGRVENPMLRSALALAGANTWAKGGKLPPEAGKGILFAQDIAGLDLWANEVTVLSACETAIGDVAIGEGVFGLRRAFAVAGAKTLIMSLWSVNGWTTALLMERFFDRCEAGLGRAAALQEAQNYLRNITVRELQKFELGRDILKQEFNNGRELDATMLTRQAENKPLAHPYYWGAWICQGDTKPIDV